MATLYRTACERWWCRKRDYAAARNGQRGRAFYLKGKGRVSWLVGGTAVRQQRAAQRSFCQRAGFYRHADDGKRRTLLVNSEAYGSAKQYAKRGRSELLPRLCVPQYGTGLTFKHAGYS